jgi:hypothetical protein
VWGDVYGLCVVLCVCVCVCVCVLLLSVSSLLLSLSFSLSAPFSLSLFGWFSLLLSSLLNAQCSMLFSSLFSLLSSLFSQTLKLSNSYTLSHPLHLQTHTNKQATYPSLMASQGFVERVRFVLAQRFGVQVPDAHGFVCRGGGQGSNAVSERQRK